MKIYTAEYNVLFLVDVLKVFKEITVLPIKKNYKFICSGITGQIERRSRILHYFFNYEVNILLSKESWLYMHRVC